MDSISNGVVLIIGAGGVGGVTAHKCAQNADVFTSIHLASRSSLKPAAIQADIKARYGVDITTHAVDAEDVDEVVALIEKVHPRVVINVALPYQNLAIMDACLESGVHYIDTAIYEPRSEVKYEYRWQLAHKELYAERGITAVLGAGFDPGVTNMYCASASPAKSSRGAGASTRTSRRRR